jgi:Predicted hydrolases or acyltransferases (alpha/beta hydrolase superfamily)
MDLRGCGKSDKPCNVEAYSIENHCNDIDGILNELHETNPFIWGWSLGATIAMQYSARKRVRGTIACGSYFGLIFSDEFIQRAIDNTQDELLVARFKAFNKWPVVVPADMKNPFLVYTGTNDGNVVVQLRKQKEETEKSNGELIVFDGLDHVGLVHAINKVSPVVGKFLETQRRRNEIIPNHAHE